MRVAATIAAPATNDDAHPARATGVKGTNRDGSHQGCVAAGNRGPQTKSEDDTDSARQSGGKTSAEAGRWYPAGEFPVRVLGA